MSKLYYNMRRLSRNSRGFTLLEILIVLALAGVIVSLSVPNFNKVIPEMRVIRAAQKLATDLRLAQQKAVSEMSVVNFFVDVNQNRYFARARNRDATGVWYQDGYDEYLKDPLNSGAFLIIDFSGLSSRFKGVTITDLSAGTWTETNVINNWGIYLSPLGDLRYPFSNTVITLSDLRTGYSRQVQISYPMAKVTLLP